MLADPHSPLQIIVPENTPRAGALWLAKIGAWGLRLLGWQIKGEFANTRKAIIVAAPHSSNWDWVIGILGLWGLRLKCSYLIKAAAFVWPLSILLRKTGGIGIDRSQPGGIVEQLIIEFDRADQLYYAITPEGTRKAVGKWKTGFLRIAYGAKVPVIPVTIDHSNKEIRVSAPFKLSGEIQQDIRQIQSYFEGVKGRYL